jgi:aspartate oxidase
LIVGSGLVDDASAWAQSGIAAVRGQGSSFNQHAEEI